MKLETPQLELHLLGQMIASPLFGWLYQKTGSARLVGLITSVAYIVGNILYSILSVFPEDYRYGLLLFSRFIVGVSSGINLIYLVFIFIKENGISKFAHHFPLLIILQSVCMHLSSTKLKVS